MTELSRPAAPARLRVEHHRPGDVLALNTDRPRLSWMIPAAPDGWRMSGYDVEITRDGTSTVHHVDSDEQILVAWPGEPVQVRQHATVRVRIRGADGSDSEWSQPISLEAGLSDPGGWLGRFIEPPDADDVTAPAPVLGGTISVTGELMQARLYVTAHGLHRAHLNGVRVADDELAPGWTSYHHRLRYQAYDVTDLLRQGENTIEVVLGNGWYRGRLGFTGQRAQYGDRVALLAQLEVQYADGRRLIHTTDEDWTARPSNIDADDLYDGQRTDLRRGPLGDPAQSLSVVVVEHEKARLVAPDGPPVRITEVIPAVDVTTSPAGRTLVDFGQNAVGWVRLRVRGLTAGDEVTIRHAEVLEDGELGTRPLRSALATDHYVMDGAEERVLEPCFTFHGFRYAEITGVRRLRAEDVELVVIGSDLERTGWFDSSHDLLNRFHDNVVWGMRGNFVDVPTDCPQRDERLGWTGDILAFAPTATFLFDSAGLLSGWLADLAADQDADGTVPWVIPDVLGALNRPTAAWGDAATFVPTTLYERTGDAALLTRQLPSMRAWVERESALAGPKRRWTGGFQFGDWLDPAAPPNDPGDAKADSDVLATAYFARSAALVAAAARIAGDAAAAESYAGLAEQVRQAYTDTYVTPSGRVAGENGDAATLYAQALVWNLLSADQRDAAGARLADLVREAAYRIATGFVGTPLVCDALTLTGHVEVAYRLLLQENCPSWLYPVTMGATTVWERWDSMLPDGSINPGEMTSFNHYALGAVADWMHRTVAGLAPGAPGYRRIVVRPRPGGGLTHATARHLTPYGRAEVGWTRDGSRLTVRATVPVGATAEVHLPDGRAPFVVGHGEHEWTLELPTKVDTSTRSTIGEVMDDPDVWPRLTELAVRTEIARDEAELARLLRRYYDQPAAELGQALTEARMRGDRPEFLREVAELIPGLTPGG